MRVLLIEDEASTAQSIEQMLKGFNVYTTDLGEEGVDLGKLYDHDIILLDLNLPDMSGFEVLRSLRVAKVKTPIYPVRPCRHRGQSQGSRDWRRRLPHQAIPKRRTRRPHPFHCAPFQRSRPIGNPDRRTSGQSRHQDGRSEQRPRASEQQGISDAGAAQPAQGHAVEQGNVPQPSLRRRLRWRCAPRIWCGYNRDCSRKRVGFSAIWLGRLSTSGASANRFRLFAFRVFQPPSKAATSRKNVSPFPGRARQGPRVGR